MLKIIDVFLNIIGTVLTILVATLQLLWLFVLFSLGLLYFFLAFPVLCVKHAIEKKSRHRDGINGSKESR